MLTGIPLIIFIFFIANAIFSISFIIQLFLEKKPDLKINNYLFCLLFSSVIWSIGMGMMSIQTSDHKAYIWRCVGIMGTFAFMILIQNILCLMSTLSLKTQRGLNIIAYSGILVYLAYIQPGQTVFVHNSIGTTFYFSPGVINVIYTFYYMLVSLNILLVTLNIAKKHPQKQIRVAGKNFIFVEILIFIGATTDLIWPALGKVAFPGSALTHFWGVVILWFTIHKLYKSEITIANMSEYVYYSVDIPVIIFDSKFKAKILNDASKKFFKIENFDILNNQNPVISDFFNITDEIFTFDEHSNSVNTTSKSTNTKCEITISKIIDSYRDVIGYIILVNDLTEHELVIQRLEEAKIAADSANMSKSLFLANMSHEIRTPLNAILGFSEIALMENVTGNIKDYFENIKIAGQALLTLINQILEISKIELGSHELNCVEYDPSKIINEVELIIGVPAKKKGLQLKIAIDQNLPGKLYGDKDKIREVLINLLNNSVKYTNLGFVALDVNVLSLSNDQIQLSLTVSDSGIGIKEENLSTIFDKFERVDSNYNSKVEGTGLGLSITKGLVELMGGTITVNSIPQVGSQFTVTLTQKIIDSSPIKITKKNIPLESLPISAPPKTNSNKILAVDDNALNIKVISKLLDKYGKNFDVASSGFVAIEKCNQEHYAMILLDKMMPEMDGIQTLKHIREIEGYSSSKECYIVALTADEMEGSREYLLSEGFDDFLGKPINLQALEEVLSRLN